MMSAAGSLEGTASVGKRSKSIKKSHSSKVAGSNMMDLLARHAESSRVGSAMIDLIARHVGVVILVRHAFFFLLTSDEFMFLSFFRSLLL